MLIENTNKPAPRIVGILVQPAQGMVTLPPAPQDVPIGTVAPVPSCNLELFQTTGRLW